MNLRIELSGLARSIAGEHTVELSVKDGASYREVVRALGEKYPGFVGPIINSEEPDLLVNSTIFSRNGEDLITFDQMNDTPGDGDRLILLTVIVGGER